MALQNKYTIRLEKMEFRAFHGCYELEQIVGNRFSVDLEVTAELGGVDKSDNVEEAVNYLTLYQIVEQQMKITRHTIEAVAAQIIAALRDQFPQIIEIRCRVAKLAPPLGGKLALVSVELVG